MTEFNNKIDFAVVLSVKNANPNGDPINGNRPRVDMDGIGEITDVCIKRKIRNRLQNYGQPIFVQMEDMCDDGCDSLSTRYDRFCKDKGFNSKTPKSERYAAVCSQWIDVRSFGQVFAFSNKDEAAAGVSMGVRGPVSIQSAFSADVVDSQETGITKSVNGESSKDGNKSSDTMGQKHRVGFGLYVTYGSINCELARKTGFSQEDAEEIKKALISLFVNDESSARPAGSMEVVKVVWWQHDTAAGQYSSAKVHKSLLIEKQTECPKSASDYLISVKPIEGLKVSVFDGD